MKNIVLIGPRAAGKSKLARNLHKTIGYESLSTDTLLQYECGGLTIPQFIEKQNGDWQAFRDLEYDVLKKVTKMQSIILDCGGGIVVDLDKNGKEIFSNRKAKLLIKKSIVVYLNANLQWLYKKIKKDPSRPILSRQSSFINMMETRHEWYSDVANITIDSTEKKGETLAMELYHILRTKREVLF